MSRFASAMTYPDLTHESFCLIDEAPRPIDEGFYLGTGAGGTTRPLPACARPTRHPAAAPRAGRDRLHGANGWSAPADALCRLVAWPPGFIDADSYMAQRDLFDAV